MKHKLKKVFENAVWWSGVIMVGLVLGISLQVVKAWTEPTEAPPNGNVGAPVNTSLLDQTKEGGLGVWALLTHGLQLFNDPDWNDDGIIEPEHDVTGKFLKAEDANGQVAWAEGTGEGGGGTYTVWGTDTCPEGTPIYTGKVAFPYSGDSAGNGYGSTICLKGGLEAYYASGIDASAYWSDGDRYFPDHWSKVKPFDCAVCKL